jgi:hypothetical protein
MNKILTNSHCVLAVAGVLSAIVPAVAEEIFQLLLANPAFTEGVSTNGVPLGWSKYGAAGQDQELMIVDGPDGGRESKRRIRGTGYCSPEK